METLGICTGTRSLSDRERSTTMQVASTLGRCVLLSLGAAGAYALHRFKPTRAVRLSLAIAPGIIVAVDAATVGGKREIRESLGEKYFVRPLLMGLSVGGAVLCLFHENAPAARFLPALSPLAASGLAFVVAQEQEGKKTKDVEPFLGILCAVPIGAALIAWARNR